MWKCQVVMASVAYSESIRHIFSMQCWGEKDLKSMAQFPTKGDRERLRRDGYKIKLVDIGLEERQVEGIWKRRKPKHSIGYRF